MVYPDDEEDVKKLEELIKASQEINYKKGVIVGKMNLLSFLDYHSDYKGMLKLIRELEALGLGNNHQQLTRLYMNKSFANDALGIEREARQDLREALVHAKKIGGDKGHIEVSYVYNATATFFNDKSPDSVFYYQKKELNELVQISNKNSKKVQMSIALNKLNIGKSYLVLKPQQLDLAEPYFMDAYNYKTTHPDIFEELDLPILCGVAHFYSYKKDYNKSLEILNEVLQREKTKNSPSYRSYAYSVLTDVYEGLGNSKEQAKYAKLYASLNDSINRVAKKEVSQQFDKLVTNVETKKEKEYSSNLKMILIATGCFILILSLITWFSWKRKNKIIHKKYEDLITKVSTEQTQQKLKLQDSVKNNETKSLVIITDNTTRALLFKLEKFETSEKYLRKDLSLTWMANNLNTNTKYLSEIIKIYRDHNFTSYINEHRINYIIKKLYENPVYREYKIAYLSEECGYSTPRVFVNAFKKETGFTPSYFIEQLKSS
ncbi:AraC family transcriptional regulator [Chryseobacterium sp. MA9]|uniref:helix-turn-helix domain-containing protein n=1 Tax=Chryseobacterium sp. MA9 TaxID=2966625 RepID=UPI00210784D8|nr:helix-turn-helix domain-containing protein [Chryseobacterium sp. MA9]UTX50048.1 helix-turn-helix domain-containing protein [Chryseobacterium sp. MA9]